MVNFFQTYSAITVLFFFQSAVAGKGKLPHGAGCVYSYQCLSGNCRLNKCYAKGIGQPCQFAYDCQSYFCSNRRCAKRLNGARCKNDNDCDSEKCGKKSGSDKKVCLGQQYSTCAGNAQCINNCKLGKCT